MSSDISSMILPKLGNVHHDVDPEYEIKRLDAVHKVREELRSRPFFNEILPQIDKYLMIGSQRMNGREHWVVTRADWFPTDIHYPLHAYDPEIFAEIGYNGWENRLHFKKIYYPKTFVDRDDGMTKVLYTLGDVQYYSLKIWNCPNCTVGVQGNLSFPVRFKNPNSQLEFNGFSFSDDIEDNDMNWNFAEKLFGNTNINATQIMATSLATSGWNTLLNFTLNGQSKLLVNGLTAIGLIGVSMIKKPMIDKYAPAMRMGALLETLSLVEGVGYAISQKGMKYALSDISQAVKRMYGSFSMGIPEGIKSLMHQKPMSMAADPIRMVGKAPNSQTLNTVDLTSGKAFPFGMKMGMKMEQSSDMQVRIPR